MTPENDYSLFPPTHDELLGLDKDFDPVYVSLLLPPSVHLAYIYLETYTHL
jgi:hypothetical protein